jgi:hypothetical protein
MPCSLTLAWPGVASFAEPGSGLVATLIRGERVQIAEYGFLLNDTLRSSRERSEPIMTP